MTLTAVRLGRSANLARRRRRSHQKQGGHGGGSSRSLILEEEIVRGRYADQAQLLQGACVSPFVGARTTMAAKTASVGCREAGPPRGVNQTAKVATEH
jgi:hypothetical protein